MSLSVAIYVYGLLDKLPWLIVLSILAVTITSIASGFISEPDYDTFSKTSDYTAAYEAWKNKIKRDVCATAAIIVTLTSTGVFIPSANTFAALILLPKIAHNKNIEQLPGNVAKVMNEAVEKWAENLEPNQER